MSTLDRISGLDDYLRAFGRVLGKKASELTDPLHVPDRDAVPDFSDIVAFNPEREPFEPQAHCVAAIMKMFDQTKGGFFCGECGVGKTIVGMLAAHKHAAGKPYRAMVLCPDHLMDKWVRELEETIPGVRARQFSSWKDVVTLGSKRSRSTGKGGKSLWQQPAGPEWYVLGRNQVKWMPKRLGISQKIPYFNADTTGTVEGAPGGLSRRLVPVGREPSEPPAFDKLGRRVMRVIVAKAWCCPACGMAVRDKKGNPISRAEVEKKALFCESLYLKEVVNDDAATPPHRLERVYHNGKLSDSDPLMVHIHADLKAGKEVKAGDRKFVVTECHEPLWQWGRQPPRWAPAKFISRKMKRFFEYLVVDEVHELKGDDSAQGNACGALIGSARYTLALTGTLIGGYADDIFALMVRMGFPSLVGKDGEGFEWKKELAFAEVYGRVDRIVTTKFGGDKGGESSWGNNSSMSMRKDTVKQNVRSQIAPGIMPSLFGNHMMGRTLFLTLDQMASNLPAMVEYVGGPRDIEVSLDGLDADAQQEALAYRRAYRENWVDVAPEMDWETAQEYSRVEGSLKAAADDLLRRGSMKLLGKMLATCLGYPDHPFGWRHSPQVAHAIQQAREAGVDINPDNVKTVGYWDKPNDWGLNNWYGVVTPADLDRAAVRPKEQALIDICKLHKAKGNQTWVYTTMTQKRDVRDRLRGLLAAEGLAAGVLDSDDVPLREREKWIRDNGRDFDVMISHPKLVSTGLDLFGKAEGAHNFNVLVFYQTGYSLYDLRQASRRSWRIGQPKECFVYYLHYRHPEPGHTTMQQRAMQIMSLKMSAAQAMDGEFSAEGLASMAGNDNAQMALARSLASNLDDRDMQRNWGRVKSGAGMKHAARPQGASRSPGKILIDPAVIDALWESSSMPRPFEPNPLAALPAPLQLVGETLAERGYDPDDELAFNGEGDDDLYQTVAAPALAATPAPAAGSGSVRIEVSREDIFRLLRQVRESGFNLDEF